MKNFAKINEKDNKMNENKSVSEEMIRKVEDEASEIIEEMIEDHSSMTNHEILTKQMNCCRHFIQRSISSNMNRVVLIHGKGEGVLKSEIISYLRKLKNYHDLNIEFFEAPYSEYGMGGATEVRFNSFKSEYK